MLDTGARQDHTLGTVWISNSHLAVRSLVVPDGETPDWACPDTTPTLLSYADNCGIHSNQPPLTIRCCGPSGSRLPFGAGEAIGKKGVNQVGSLALCGSWTGTSLAAKT